MVAYVFNDADLQILQRVIDREKLRIVNVVSPVVTDRWDQGEDHQAPETYVAKTPQSGINALDQAYGDVNDEPGSAECDIYQVIDGPETPRFLRVGELFQRVYNLSTSSVAGDSWIPITRDKFGRWLVLVGGGSVIGEIINFRVLQWFPAADPATYACAVVLAVVELTSCSSAVAVGDEVLIVDWRSRFFNLPIELLVGATGMATWMSIADVVSQLECPHLLSQYGDTDCAWVVQTLDCVEEVYYGG